MKTFLLSVTALFYSLVSTAQTCIGGTDFSSAVFFDQGWIYNCGTGTSCQPGTTNLDNSCDPSTALETCVPTPSCGNVSDMGSDLWFKFLANTTTATISVSRNSSFYVGIQAFAAPHFNFTPDCSVITEVGCIASGSPNGNTQLVLTSLTPGDLYFFRVYGIATNVHQRTGNFCFCGSTGLTATALPIKLTSFSALSSGKLITLKWTADQQESGGYFEIEKSINGNSFTSIGREPVMATNSSPATYYFEENAITTETVLYRLKMVDASGEYGYSNMVLVNNKSISSGLLIKQDRTNHSIIIYSDTDTDADIFTIAGNKIMSLHLTRGDTPFYSQLEPGIYLIRKKNNGESKKLVIY